MRTFLAIVLLLNLVVPGQVRETMARDFQPIEPAGHCRVVPAAHSCPCCPPAECDCAKGSPQLPVPSQPTPAPRPVSIGDPRLVIHCDDLTMPMVLPAGKSRQQTRVEAFEESKIRQRVPLYLRLCSRLL